MRTPRKPEPRIIDPVTHQQRWVSITVAAEFLETTWRSVDEWIAEGKLHAERKGRRRKIQVDELAQFKARQSRHQIAS